MTIAGRAVQCVVCGRRKAPRGRSVPDMLANSLCDWECPGWRQSPHPGDLWPGETAEDFGYPCEGAEEVAADAQAPVDRPAQKE